MSSSGTPQAVHDSLHQDDKSNHDLVIGRLGFFLMVLLNKTVYFYFFYI